MSNFQELTGRAGNPLWINLDLVQVIYRRQGFDYTDVYFDFDMKSLQVKETVETILDLSRRASF